MVELIKKKRKGLELSKEEYAYIVDGLVSGEIPDYQLSAFMMAVYFQGMNSEETAVLTDLMMRSGELVDLSEIKGIKVDKHSTGGVGDKTTLILGPLVAAAGVPVAKMSGRGLGHTGGTLDKLESIKGLTVDMSKEEFIKKIQKHNIAICGQNQTLVPADKKLYALRDVTATVENLSLIASSIMSKKLACGADAIVIDIKVGKGAYMKSVEQAEELAKMMTEIGAKMNRAVVAVITSMDEPLGLTVGNAIEVKEAIDTLKGNGPKDLTDLCLKLGSHMLVLGKVVPSYEEGVEILKTLIDSGAAFEKFKELIAAQGGDPKIADHPEQLPTSTFEKEFVSEKDGFVAELDALDIGIASMKLGAGRENQDSKIDFGAGIILKKKIGDPVKAGETLALMYTNQESDFAKAEELLAKAFTINTNAAQKKPLILKTIM